MAIDAQTVVDVEVCFDAVVENILAISTCSYSTAYRRQKYSEPNRGWLRSLALVRDRMTLIFSTLP